MDKSDVVTVVMSSLIVILVACCVVWFIGSANPQTPAGYIGYLTQNAVFGQTHFYGMQTGPISPGRTWMVRCTNVSITPTTYSEAFTDTTSVLSKDNLKMQFTVHIVWKVNPEQVQAFVEKFSTLYEGNDSDKVLQVAYDNNLKEILRTAARDEVQKLDGLALKSQITDVGQRVFDKIEKMTTGTPFMIKSIVVGNIQYPDSVSNAVSEKLSMTQVLERKKIEIEVEMQEKQKRIVQAEGLAKAMELVNSKLTSLYVQHEAIEAQKLMVGSPNHTTIYVPVGPMGVPLVSTINPGQDAVK